MLSKKPISPAVVRTLHKLGRNLRTARLQRRLPMDIVAERAMTTRQTLARAEQGDPGVGIGIYLSVLQALGLLDTAKDLAAPIHDRHGAELAIEQLPTRAFLPGTRIAGSPTARARKARKTS